MAWPTAEGLVFSFSDRLNDGANLLVLQICRDCQSLRHFELEWLAGAAKLLGCFCLVLRPLLGIEVLPGLDFS